MKRISKFIACVAVIILLSTNAFAARGFGTVNGVGSTDKIQTGFVGGWQNLRALSLWFVNNGSYSNFNNMIGNGDTLISENGGSTSLYWAIHYTGGFNIFTFTIPTGNSWHHLCIWHDTTLTSNTPTVYLDGVLTSSTLTTSGSGTPTSQSQPVYIGNVSSGNQVWGGALAHVAIWNGTLLTANECQGLYRGGSPLKVRFANLAVYMPLTASQASEPDWGSRAAGTLTGTKAYTSNPPTRGFPFLVYGQ